MDILFKYVSLVLVGTAFIVSCLVLRDMSRDHYAATLVFGLSLMYLMCVSW